MITLMERHTASPLKSMRFCLKNANAFSRTTASEFVHPRTYHRSFSTVRPYIPKDSTSTHFGYSEIPVDEKEGKVRDVFNKVAETYDLMNDLMSGGMHRLWKDYLLEESNVAAMARHTRKSAAFSGGGDISNKNNDDSSVAQQLKILDVAGGTGDVAFRFVDAAGCLERAKSSGTDPVSVTVCDINPGMLRVGEARARAKFGSNILDGTKGLTFIQGNAQSLDFDDNTFDLYTIAFGLRNVTNVDVALAEALRVLKPGGRFMCLEFSHVTLPILAQLYEVYSFQVIPALGEWVAKDRSSYQYLVESIRKFPNQADLMSRIRGMGFCRSKYTNLTGGIVALHEGWKSI
ncbi:hypothetical protein ACA910_002829 [Epithemia clementina (nom. ined.)]